jgi:hypothetical protein
VGGLNPSAVEFVYGDTTAVVERPLPLSALADAVRAIGPERCVMATDSGQLSNPPAVQQMARVLHGMSDQGHSKAELRLMTRDNPADLLVL